MGFKGSDQEEFILDMFKFEVLIKHLHRNDNFVCVCMCVYAFAHAHMSKEFRKIVWNSR